MPQRGRSAHGEGQSGGSSARVVQATRSQPHQRQGHRPGHRSPSSRGRHSQVPGPQTVQGRGGPEPWQQVAGSPSLRERTSPTARCSVREKRSPGSPNPTAASSPLPHPPSQELPFPGDWHAFPVGRSLHAPSTLLGCSPVPEVPVASAAAAHWGLALTTATAFSSSCTTSRAVKPERLPSATAAPRPGPAHCPRLREGPPLPTPVLKAFSALVTLSGSSGPDACALCRSVQSACAVCLPVRSEGRTAPGVAGAGILGVEG